MRFALVILLFTFAHTANAHVPVMVVPERVIDVQQIEDPEISRAYYGELTGFPHTFEITATKPFVLYAQVLEPDIDGVENNHSGIIIKERENGRGVEEVARLRSREASWESFYEPFGADRYLKGGQFEKEVAAGVYRIEVSTPVNKGKYVLSVGKIEDFSDVGYFETVANIYKVKQFFGKSPISMLVSPFIYIPLIVIGLAGFFGRRYYKKYYG